MTNPESPMNWTDVLADPSLEGLPYKIELNEGGRIVMTPLKNRHSIVLAKIAQELNARPAGKTWFGGSIRGRAHSVHVADLVWMSQARMALHGAPDPMVVAPEICVEARWTSNLTGELARKIEDYFAAGAVEVWVVRADGSWDVLNCKSGSLLDGAEAPWL